MDISEEPDRSKTSRRFAAMKRFLRTVLAVAGFSLVALQSSHASTRVLWNINHLTVLVGRTMDWPESTQPILTVFPRGMLRDGGRMGPVEVVKTNPFRWTSLYGSLVTTAYGLGTVDGINERGLGAHMLYFNACNFGPRDPNKPGIQAGLWAQYLLDNAATVSDALALLDGVQFVMTEAPGAATRVHVAIEDASGDSAIIEYVNGKCVIHHGREFRILTNDPEYDQQLEALKAQNFIYASSTVPLPGNVNATDRFVRTAYFLPLLPEPKSDRDALASMLSILRNVSVPFGAHSKDSSIFNTDYRTVSDLGNKRYYFELTTSANVIWVELEHFRLKPGAKVMILNPDNPKLSGDVSHHFSKAEKPPF